MITTKLSAYDHPKKYKITKDKIIEAILTEPLQHGNFFHDVNERDNGKCNVCAVGAVLRNTKKNHFSFTHAARATDSDYECWKYECSIFDGLPFLSKLSIAFEAFCEQYHFQGHEPEVRDFLLHIIEAYAPDTVEFVA